MVDEARLAVVEKHYPLGLTSVQLLEVFAAWNIQLSEATLRKYVQLGLLPRSVRVGRKGKHQGSQGIYPVGVARQILRIKALLADDFTIEQIQRAYSEVWSQRQQLEQVLHGLFKHLREIVSERQTHDVAHEITHELESARGMGFELLSRLSALEARLGSRTQQQLSIS